MTSQFDVDVLVVGAGPAGATVAAEVARAGARVMAVEKRTGDSPSRAGVIQPRVLEQLANRDLMGRFREAAADWRPDFEVPIYMYAGLGGLRYFELNSDYPYALILPQTTTEHLLRAWAVEEGAEVRRGVAYVGHTQVDDGVLTELVDEEGSGVRIRSRYLVGADGARSKVRTVGGVPFEGRETTLTAMSVDADLSFPWEASMRMSRNEAGWVLAYPFGVNTTRFIIVAEESRNLDTTVPVTMEEVQRSLTAIFGSDFGVTSAKRVSRYGDMHKMVPQLRDGRVLLVGEATRVHYPASGIGMNYCIQDAFNLGWKLGAAATGTAPDELLDTYHDERFPVLQALMDDVDVQTSLHFDFSEGGLKLKDFVERELVPLPGVNEILRNRLSGFGTSYRTGEEPHPAIGLRVPPLQVNDGRRYAQVAADSSFVLIDRDEVDAGRQLDPAITVVQATDLSSVESFHDPAAVLIRPDGYVAFAWNGTPTDAEVEDEYRRALHKQMSRDSAEVLV